MADRVQGVFDGAGVHWRGSRWGGYAAILEEVASLNPETAVAFRKADQKQRLLFEAAGQVFQLDLASRLWTKIDRKLVRRSLEQVRNGSALPGRGDDKARNILLELVAAASLADIGFHADLTDDEEDVRLVHDVIGRVAVECKRPSSLGALEANLKRARAQLVTRLANGAAYGIPIIGMDRIAGLSGALMKATTTEELDKALFEMRTTVIREIVRLCRKPHVNFGPRVPVAFVIVVGAALVTHPKPNAVVPVTIVHPFTPGDAPVPDELDAILTAPPRSGLWDEFRA